MSREDAKDPGLANGCISEHRNEVNLNQVNGYVDHIPSENDDENSEARSIVAEATNLVISASLKNEEAVLQRISNLLCKTRKAHIGVVHHLVEIPFRAFTEASITCGIPFWTKVMRENPRLESKLFAELFLAWERTIDHRLGVFDSSAGLKDPFWMKQEFAPSKREELQQHREHVLSMLAPHNAVFRYFTECYATIKKGSPNTQKNFLGMLRRTMEGLKKGLHHPLARKFWFQVTSLALQTLRLDLGLSNVALWQLHDQILSTGLFWFKFRPMWSFGDDAQLVQADVTQLTQVLEIMKMTNHIGIKATRIRRRLQPKQELLRLLVENERNRLMVWMSPLERESGEQVAKETISPPLVSAAWSTDPGIAVQLATRFHSEPLHQAIRWQIVNFPEEAVEEADALDILLGPSMPVDVTSHLKFLAHWAPVNPMQAITYFLPAYRNHPLILQYAMRTLRCYSADATFFYVPQIVQCLRYDVLGYVERYILETAASSQLFAHQIIWNMKANAYQDEDSQIEDPLKPTLDKVMADIEAAFSKEDREFYEREFSFFREVTSISGKLKPFIKKSKEEKKAKIREELGKITIQAGVYLPSNPSGVVVGIDRESGKPLQSHAKAPFLTTFQIQELSRLPDAWEGAEKASHPSADAHDAVESHCEVNSGTEPITAPVVQQSAIFKVGDDCRQDVLALQMIAVFRSIFHSCGLDVFVHPYRVTATAPGCGVIDVLPNSVSRDILGREGVTSLYEYFITKYGPADRVEYQQAQANFIQSMAAYSVICYLLQFKDRHNGNIMLDDAGHIVHIDFGFCFDIVPGGVKFERAPFKLTAEMMAVMGKDSSKPQTYQRFEELTIRAFLASRLYVDRLSHLVLLMLDSGLPCFKPETMRHFRHRFVLDKTERGAAEYMRYCIRKSEDNYSTKIYDEFQFRSNGIPY